METDFIFFSSKITVDRDCSLEIKTWLFLGRKAMTNSILKSEGITLLMKVCRVKIMVYPIVMYGCESWTIRRLSAKELMFLDCGAREES